MTPARRRGLGVGRALAAVVVATLGLGGCGTGGSPSPAASSADLSVPPAASGSPAPSGTAARSGTAAPTGSSAGITSTPGLQLHGPQPLPASVRLTPTRVRIPAIGVDSTLQQLRTKSGVLQPPTDPLQAGWWSGGPVPGEPGPAVIAGHLDSYTGPAVFIDLSELHAGDLVDVTRSDGSTAVFVVDSVDVYQKSAFPTQAVYGPTPGAALRLITCGGTFDRSKQLYLANVVVFASLRVRDRRPPAAAPVS